MSDEDRRTLLRQLDRKGRGTIAVSVQVTDAEGAIVCSGVFQWSVQKRS